jgi:hypothetical protein
MHFSPVLPIDDGTGGVPPQTTPEHEVENSIDGGVAISYLGS